ncbi:hypothetical protein QXB71_003912 [Vibrio cholerae]|nr:hypothetical protein [Vibrio cholerae]ELO1828635.1 hypothetical protein [Vibrio cholerae]
MTTDSMITLVGTVVTVISMFITICQVVKAKKYREQIKFDIRKINLASCAERLRRAQDDIRRLPLSTTSIQRGVKVPELILSIKAHFDYSIGAINSQGPDSDIRGILTNAQQKLNDYEIGFNSQTINHTDVHELQSLIQDSISTSNSRIFELEGKA